MKSKSCGLLCCLMLAVGGCAELSREISPDPRRHQDQGMSSTPQAIEELVGPWEYTDKTGTYTIMFDAEGKGTYEWEQGRFETQSLRHGVWRGTWAQEGNDREGEFTLTFSEVSPVAQGEWWYTRIGKDHDPLQSGGQFSLSRPSALQLAQ